MLKRRGERYDVAFYIPGIAPVLATNDIGSTGGVETQYFLVARALARLHLRVCICAFDRPDAVIPANVEGVDVVLRRPYLRRGRLRRAREALALIVDLVRLDANVLVTSAAGYHVGLVAIASRLRRRTFVYASASGPDFASEPPNLTRRDRVLYRLGLCWANQIVVQTEDHQQLCLARTQRTSTLIPNPIEEARARVQIGEAFLWVGRGVWYKAPNDYVALARAVPEAHFWAVCAPGVDGEDTLPEFERLASEVPNLELLPPRPRPELMKLIDRAVAIVNTSLFEGMPNVSLEGWARGVPTLALAHDPGEVIESNGLGFFAQGSAQSLSIAAREYWEGRSDQSELADRCRRYTASEHSEERVAEAWQRIIAPPSRPFGHASFRKATEG